MSTGKLRILLVEDDVNFGAVMRDYLAMNGYDVVLATDGNKGWNRFNNELFDLCILDVMMPEKDGMSLANDIRKVNSEIPLIFLTAKSMKEDMLKGFQLGADDYITKPFDSEILLYKLKSIINRSKGKGNVESENNSFQIGKYHFNYKLRTIEIGDIVRKLSPKESELIKMLCLHQNDILPRDKALMKIWGEDNYFTARSMDVFITKIRKYFKEDPAIEIVNVHGNGFRLITG